MGRLSASERTSIKILAGDGLNARTISRLLQRDHRAVQAVLDGREYARPGPTTKYPSRETVERVVAEEAKAHRVNVAEVLGASNRIAAKRARNAAVERIMQETGCSHRGLETVWGASLKRLSRRRSARSSVEHATLARLTWQYGEARARQIASGKDPNTRADLTAWKRLCALGGAR